MVAHRCHVALERSGRLVVRLRIQRPRPDLVVDVLVQMLLYGCKVLQTCKATRQMLQGINAAFSPNTK